MLLHNTAHERSLLNGVLLQEKIRSKRVVVESELMVDGVNGQFLSVDTAARNVSGILAVSESCFSTSIKCN